MQAFGLPLLGAAVALLQRSSTHCVGFGRTSYRFKSFQTLSSANKKPRTRRGSLFDMVRLGGFEPPTARFVAEYSIQLSYSRLKSFSRD